MTDAPERIWALIEPDWHDGEGEDFLGGTWDAGHLKEGFEYIRADLIAKKNAALLAAEELAKAVDVQHTAIGLTPICAAALSAFRAAMEDTQ